MTVTLRALTPIFNEARFCLNGFVNKQNMHSLLSKNIQVFQETPLHRQKITIWCGFHVGGVIGPFFSVAENECHVSVNENRYRDKLQRYFFGQFNGLDINDKWFQKDGATSYIADVTLFKKTVVKSLMENPTLNNLLTNSPLCIIVLITYHVHLINRIYFLQSISSLFSLQA